MKTRIALILLIPFLAGGCAAIREIQDNAQSIVGGVVESFVGASAGEKIVEAGVAPSVISVTEALLASVAVITGGVAGWVGVKKGKKLKAKKNG